MNTELRNIINAIAFSVLLLFIGSTLHAETHQNSSVDTIVLSDLYKSLSSCSKNPTVSELKSFVAESQRQKDEFYLGKGYFMLINHYVNTNFDSMKYYIDKAQPIFIRQNLHEELCRSYMGLSYYYSNIGNKKAAMDAVRSMRQVANGAKDPYLNELADIAVAVNYFRDNLKEESMQILNMVLANQEKRDAPLNQRFNTLRQLINETNDPTDRLKYLEKMKRIIEEMKEKNMNNLGNDLPMSEISYLYYRCLVQTQIGLHHKEPAMEAINKMSRTIHTYNLNHRKVELYVIKAYYYEMTGEYEKEIAELNAAVFWYNKKNKPQAAAMYLEMKGNAERKAGWFEDASDSFRQLIALKDSINDQKYYASLAQIKAELDVSKLEADNRKVALDQATMKGNVYKLIGLLAVVVLASLFFLYLYLYQKRMSRKLKDAKELAEQNERMKSDFLANMNHEIRTPLNAIVGFSQIIAEEPDESTRHEYAEIINVNNETLQRLITDVLDISKIESKQMTLNFSDVDLPKLMDEIYRITSLRMPNSVKLELTSCEPLVFNIDRTRLMQILTNLLNNALKHTNSGYIRFGYQILGSHIAFEVADSGEGIAKDKLDSIFSRFVQLKDWNRGVGLGLAICKGLVVKMNGTIDVRSEAGHGSVFTVILPLQRDLENTKGKKERSR